MLPCAVWAGTLLPAPSQRQRPLPAGRKWEKKGEYVCPKAAVGAELQCEAWAGPIIGVRVIQKKKIIKVHGISMSL